MKKKNVICIGAIGLIMGFVFTIFLITSQHKVSTDLTIQNTSVDTSKLDKPLTVTNYPVHENTINKQDLEAFLGSVDEYLNDDGFTKSYNATIRDNSINISSSGTISELVFIIDIPAVKRSYKASIGKDSSTGQNTIYTLCLSSDEMKYPYFACKDDLNNG
jgi:hypothetical protein